MLLHNESHLAAALRLLKINVPHAFNVSGELVSRLEEEAHAEFPELGQEAVEFIARIRAAKQTEQDIKDREAALEADKRGKAELEEKIRSAQI